MPTALSHNSLHELLVRSQVQHNNVEQRALSTSSSTGTALDSHEHEDNVRLKQRGAARRGEERRTGLRECTGREKSATAARGTSRGARERAAGAPPAVRSGSGAATCDTRAHRISSPSFAYRIRFAITEYMTRQHADSTVGIQQKRNRTKRQAHGESPPNVIETDRNRMEYDCRATDYCGL